MRKIGSQSFFDRHTYSDWEKKKGDKFENSYGEMEKFCSAIKKENLTAKELLSKGEPVSFIDNAIEKVLKNEYALTDYLLGLRNRISKRTRGYIHRDYEANLERRIP